MGVLASDSWGQMAGTSHSPGPRRAVVIGNFTPRICGIATFTRDLLGGLSAASAGTRWDIVAMNDREPGYYAFGPEVRHVIQQECTRDYLTVAEAINRSDAEAVFVQHEFGIFGGAAGEHLLLLLRHLRAPVVVTLHTVLASPSEDQRRVLREIIALSRSVVVMAATGARLLRDVYQAPRAKIRVIPHGAPSRPLAATGPFKTRFGFEGRQTLLTFGHLSPNKGIEAVVRAMPQILQRSPNALYVVAGATHPNLVRDRGEEYRESLVLLTEHLEVGHAVRFIDRYMADSELVDLLQASDVYVTPYLNEAQITSGTLSYAIALGRPVVSTPYWHASEALANGIGVLCPFGDSAAFGRAIGDLLVDDEARAAMGRRAWRAGLSSRWSTVGAAHLRAAGFDLEAAAEESESPQDPRAFARAHG